MNLVVDDAQIETADREGDGDGTAQVCLVNMPYCPITRPSLALGVLKACLRGTGITCAVEYANLRFAELIGVDALRVLACSRNEYLIGEWTFAGAAFPEHRTEVEDAIGRTTIADLTPDKSATLSDLTSVWKAAREFAPTFVEETAQRVMARRPRIVGCTSTFEQQTASLALLRRIKELDPGIVTMLGGANCEAEMGWAVIQEFPWVDFVVSGEAEEIFAPLCKMALRKGTAIDPVLLPNGVFSARHVKAKTYAPGRATPPRAVLEQMDKSPVPDFDEYFAALERSPIRSLIVPALPVESSRGCWWGQKSHCTFCGLNGDGMRFRAKSPDRVLEELDYLVKRHGVKDIQMADNILDMNHLRTVIPALADAGAPYDMFYEIKANLKREQVALLSRAGVSKVQPGVESLHDGLLKLMAKGSTAAINIDLLKHTRQFGIHSVWLMLVGFPGEDDYWHIETAAMLPLLHHLQPPADVLYMRFDRFSVYHSNPEQHGLKLKPYPAYGVVYPAKPERLQDLAYFFLDDNNAKILRDRPGIAALKAAVWRWIRTFGRDLRPVLCAEDNGDSIRIFDTREVATARLLTLTGLEAEVYRGCDPSIARETLRKRMGASGAATESEIEAAISSLVAKRIVVDIHGKLVALCIPDDVPELGGVEDAPGGWTVGLTEPLSVAIVRARERLHGLRQQSAATVPALTD